MPDSSSASLPPGRDIIVVGASAGGVDALVKLFRELPSDLEAAVFVVLHMPSDSPGRLALVLDRAGPLRSSPAEDGAEIEKGRIYVAVPDHHLLLEPDKMRVVHGPKENRHRPAIDALFRSAAVSFGSRVIGVILSGTLDDGTAGLLAIKQRGGLAVVQDPQDAVFSGMPQSALDHVDVDHVVPGSEIGSLLVSLQRTMYQRPETIMPK